MNRDRHLITEQQRRVRVAINLLGMATPDQSAQLVDLAVGIAALDTNAIAQILQDNYDPDEQEELCEILTRDCFGREVEG